MVGCEYNVHRLTWVSLMMLLVFFLQGCGSCNQWSGSANGEPRDTLAFTVISIDPLNLATGVPINTMITATFSQMMDGSTFNAETFTLTDPNGIGVTGVVTFDSATNVATFNPTGNLFGNTLYTATISGAVEDVSGDALTDDFFWTFTTGGAPDTTLPLVISTIPVDADTGVAVNARVTATFSEPIDVSTMNDETFLVVGPGGTPISGSVTYASIARTATFTPASNLSPNTTYTATVTTEVQDLAGNALAGNETWTFTTAAIPDTTRPTVISTNPANNATNVPVTQSVNATFSEDMNASTIAMAPFTLTGPGSTPVTGTVSYDVSSRIATFVPVSDLAHSITFTATISTGAEDLAGNAMASDFVWTFRTADAPSGGQPPGVTPVNEPPVNLRTLSTFAIVAGAGLTNSNSGGQTTINGDVGLSPTGTCLGDGVDCSVVNPIINGTLYANDAGGVAADAKADLVLAYNDAAGRPPGTTVNDISGMILPPGVYTSGSTMSIAVGGTLTLDARGNANEVWIFQVGSSLTINNNAQVLLINGARASNVYWAIAASSTIGTNVSFAGNVLAVASNSVETGSTVNGRLLSSDGQVTLLANTITIPSP